MREEDAEEALQRLKEEHPDQLKALLRDTLGEVGLTCSLIMDEVKDLDKRVEQLERDMKGVKTDIAVVKTEVRPHPS